MTRFSLERSESATSSLRGVKGRINLLTVSITNITVSRLLGYVRNDVLTVSLANQPSVDSELSSE